jgi:hypothetical protein
MRFLTKQGRLTAVLMALAIMGVAVAMPVSAYAASAAWTSHPASDDTQLWRGVVWSPELKIFVSVGTGANGAMTSPDGIIWTSRSTPDANHAWRGVAWSPQLHLFAAVGSVGSGTTTVMTSPDGITWTLRDPGALGSYMGITWSPEQGKFVATAAPAGGALTSPDGITWTPASTPPVGGRNVIWSAHDSQYVTGRSPTASIYTSPDGQVWTPRAAPIATLGIAYSEANDTYVAVGTSGIISSNDGITWTSQTSPVTNLRAVVWSPENSEFVAIGSGDIVTSPDGITWTAVTAPSANTWDAITWSAQLSRYVATSTTGTNRTMVGLVPTVASAPLNLTASLDGKNVNLSWNTPAFDGNTVITGYRIERSSNGGPFEELVANTASVATTYTDTTAALGTSYTYRIYALNAQGQSAVSNVVSMQIPAAGNMLADTGINQQTVIWLAASLFMIAGILLKTNVAKSLTSK